MEKAYLQTETGVKIPFMFNPKSFDLTVTAQWAEKRQTGKSVPERFFQGGDSGKMSMDMFLDTTDTGDPVTKHTNVLLKLLEVDTSLTGYNAAKNNGRPPWVQFHWGKTVSFRSMVKSLTINYTFFSSDGTPLRASTKISLEQYEDTPKLTMQNPTSGTPLPHRTHVVSPGETLDRIAAAHYGDPTKWRAIAETNRLHDPLALRPGMRIVIPRIEGVMSG